MIPRAFVGSGEGGGIYLVDEGVDDAGTAIALRAESNAIAPEGVGLDYIFDRVWFTITHAMAVTLRVTPVVDGVALGDASFDIVLGEQATETVRVFERAIRRPFLRNEVEVYRFAPRGTWLSLRVESVGALGTGRLFFDEIELKYDIATPTKERTT